MAELAGVPLALVRGRKEKLVITYQRVSEYPDTFSGRMQEATARLNAHKAAQEQYIADVKAADPTSRIGEKIGPKWLGIRRAR